VIFALDDDEWWDRLASCINALDYYCLLPIARLLRLCLATLFGTRNNHCRRDNAYQKPRLVKVVDIRFLDTILSDCVLYKSEPATNDLWIFAFGPLVVVFSIKTYSKLWLPFNEG
jgi:hypothetical protein